MARPKVPTIPDDKLLFYREQLFRELSNMFKWEGLPTTVPPDYLERNLVRYGYVLYYEDEEIGQDVLRCEVTGYNRHERPVWARTFTPNTIDERTQIERRLRWLSENKNVVDDFDRTTDGVLISNMEYGQNCWSIVEHYAMRLALAQQAFDTNLMYANMPYIFKVNNDDTRLSIEKMFASIYKGEPFIIVDKYMMADNQDGTGISTDIPFIAKDIMDVHNEIMQKFRQTVGFNTAGVDKAERVNTLEIQSNDQHTRTVLQIMLSQRQMACEAINAFFGTNVSVELLAPPEAKEVEEDGNNNSGTGATTGEN